MGAPIKNTCPDIDKAIKWVKGAMKAAKDGMSISENGSKQHDCFYDVDYQLDGVIDMLEDLRNANDALRKWGEGLENELQDATEIINDLEKAQQVL